MGIKDYGFQKLVSVAGLPATETGITITNVLLLLYEAQRAVAAAHEVEARREVADADLLVGASADHLDEHA